MIASILRMVAKPLIKRVLRKGAPGTEGKLKRRALARSVRSPNTEGSLPNAGGSLGVLEARRRGRMTRARS